MSRTHWLPYQRLTNLVIKIVPHVGYIVDHIGMHFDGDINYQGALAKKRFVMMVELGTSRKHVNPRRRGKFTPVNHVWSLAV